MLRVMLGPDAIAERVISHLREEGFIDYPFTRADLDSEIERWCEKARVKLGSLQRIRETVAALPGVKRTRLRLNSFDPRHQYIRRRLRASGQDGDYPTVYFITCVD